jgi:hypothetical protein
MTRTQLLQAFADAYEQVIGAATEAAQRGVANNEDGWGPRAFVAHLAGWEVMATVRIPAIVGGMAPMEFADAAQERVMNNAINAAFVALIGDQPLDAVCGILRQAYRRDVELLKTLDERHFQPGEYVYERTRAASEHCHEHIEDIRALIPAHP